MQLTNIIRTISLIGACALAVTTSRAVSPPPDGGYPNFNTAEGDNALFSVTPGIENTAIGFQALFSDIASGDANTAIGVDALLSNTTGQNNTANGAFALQNNTTGGGNTATGIDTLFSNTTGSTNTANGASALFSNTTGIDNTADGASALFSNTTGIDNTANGVDALLSNTTGFNNTAGGSLTMQSNTTGFNNTAIGRTALPANTTGSNNTAIGFQALLNNTTGASNIALGMNAGNVLTGSNNIDIGNVGAAGESGIIRIGTKGTQNKTAIAGISGVTVAGGVGVIIDTNGRLGTVVSSERYKDAIKPMDEASEAILALKPVSFRYKHELDPEGIPQFGLVAEQVEKVNPALVARDERGKAYTVRYEAVNAMLLNEFLKEHRKVEEQEATITRLKAADTKQEATIAQQQTEIRLLASQVQKVSNEIELIKPAPRVVSNR